MACGWHWGGRLGCTGVHCQAVKGLVCLRGVAGRGVESPLGLAGSSCGWRGGLGCQWEWGEDGCVAFGVVWGGWVAPNSKLAPNVALSYQLTHFMKIVQCGGSRLYEYIYIYIYIYIYVTLI